MTYAVLRISSSGYRPTVMCEPSCVVRIEKRSEASIMGMIVDEEGNELDYGFEYDARPSYEKSHRFLVSNLIPPKRLRPGRFNADRLIAVLPTCESAYAALRAAEKAWRTSRDTSYAEARARHQVALAALKAEKDRLDAEVQERLRPMVDASRAAQRAENEAAAAMHERMTAAAKAAAEACVPVTEAD